MRKLSIGLWGEKIDVEDLSKENINILSVPNILRVAAERSHVLLVMKMIGKTPKLEGAVPLSRVKEILEDRMKQRELTYEQQLAYEHAKKFAVTDASKDAKLKKLLESFSLSDKALLKIIDIRPRTQFTLRQILIRENRAFTDEEISKIVATIKEHG